MSIRFHGVVRAVSDPETRSFTANDGSDQSLTRLRVVAESGPLVDKTLDDGRVVKERANKNFYDLEGWGGVGRGLAKVNPGEAVHVNGEIRQADPVKLESGEMFYPKDTLRVAQLDFIGPNKAATKGLGVDAAVNGLDAEVGANMNGAEIEPF